jgi:hypothetical protein
MSPAGENSACAPLARQERSWQRRHHVLLHREKDGVVYQRSSLGGEWYVFRNNPVGTNDEVRKLVKGDRVSQELSDLKAPL